MSEKFPYMISEDYCSNWTIKEAIREIISNALDTKQEIEFSYNNGFGIIANKNSELKKQHLLLGASENRNNTETIGQFGEGFKIAALVLTRQGRKFSIRSSNKEYVFTCEKNSEFDTNMLTVEIQNSREPIKDTIANIECSSKEFESAKSLFMSICPVEKYTDKILKEPGNIYVMNVKVAENYGTLFGYNIMEKTLLNRDRTILDKTKIQKEIINILEYNEDIETNNLYIEAGLNKSTALEMNFDIWVNYSVKEIWRNILNEKFGEKIALSCGNPSSDSQAQYWGYNVIQANKHFLNILSWNLNILYSNAIKLANISKYIQENQLTVEERKHLRKARNLITVLTNKVYDIYITDELEESTRAQVQGKQIYVGRKELKDFPTIFSVLAHEICHINSGRADCTSGFEEELTEFIEILAQYIQGKRTPQK